jgi:hypothetical protein
VSGHEGLETPSVFAFGTGMFGLTHMRVLLLFSPLEVPFESSDAQL